MLGPDEDDYELPFAIDEDEPEDEPEDESEDETDSDNDAMSMSSDASDALCDFEETGHISMDTTRDSIQKMLVLTRSQAETIEIPAWMNESCDEVIAGEFVDGTFVQARRHSHGTSFALKMCPMLTDEECDLFYEQMSDPYMTIDYFVDGINIKRMRDYDTARVKQLHWPAWVDIDAPMLQLVEIVERD